MTIINNTPKVLRSLWIISIERSESALAMLNKWALCFVHNNITLSYIYFHRLSHSVGLFTYIQILKCVTKNSYKHNLCGANNTTVWHHLFFKNKF